MNYLSWFRFPRLATSGSAVELIGTGDVHSISAGKIYKTVGVHAGVDTFIDKIY